MTTDTTDSQEPDAQLSLDAFLAGETRTDGGQTLEQVRELTPPPGIRCLCGSTHLLVLRTTIERTASGEERREWRVRCGDCEERGVVIGEWDDGVRRMSPTLKRTTATEPDGDALAATVSDDPLWD